MKTIQNYHGIFVPWYSMGQLITMVKMYHSKNQGTINPGNTKLVLSW
jgi:hypothetical protein